MELNEQADAVRTRQDLIRFIYALRDDLERNGADANDWENPDLSRYLEAMSSWLPQVERYYENSGEPVPEGLTQETLTWRVLAQVLCAAKIYE